MRGRVSLHSNSQVRTLVAFLLLTLPPSSFQAAQRNPTPGPEPSPLNLSGYIQVLDGWSARLQKAHADKAAAAGLLRDLPDHWRVEVQGQQFVVTTLPLRSALAEMQRDPAGAARTAQELSTRLRMMRAAAVSMMNGEGPRDDSARACLQKILSRREFRSSRAPSFLLSLDNRLFRWIARLIAHILAVMAQHPAATGNVVWALLIGLALAFGAWLVRTLLLRTPESAAALEAPAEGIRTWEDFVREALIAAGRGNFREALRLAYWAGIHKLEKLGIWQLDRTRTHREYLRLLPAGHPQYASFAALTRRFELTWYAFQPASTDDFREALSWLESLECPPH